MNQSLVSRNVVATLLLLTTAGCGPGEAPEGWGADTHADMAIASTAPGGGALTVDYDFSREVTVSAPQCIGGDGADCLGGIVLYGGEAPGFAALLEDEPEESFYALVEGIEVRLVLTDRSPEASLFLNSVSLDTVGESVVLGESLEGLHIHGEFQVALPGGTEPSGDYRLAFKLVTDSPLYGESGEFLLLLHADPNYAPDADHDHDHD